MLRHRVRDALIAAYTRANKSTPVHDTDNEVMLVRPDHLGDLLFLFPGLRRFRENLPDRTVSLVVGPWSRAVAERGPKVDKLLSFPFPGFTRQPNSHPIEPYRALRDWAVELRLRQPAAMIVLREDHWWAAVAAQLAGIPLRIGADHPVMRPYLMHRIEVAGHAVERNGRILDEAIRILGASVPLEPLVPASNPLIWPVSDHERTAAQQRLLSLGVSQPFLMLHPGSGAAVKLWPAARWAAVVSQVALQTGVDIVLAGGPGEAALIQEIAAQTSADVNVLPVDLGLGELAAIMEQATLVVGVDSGPLHLAVATGTATLQLYGPSDLRQYGPWGNPARQQVISAGWQCPRCGDLSPGRPAGCGCMLAISVDAVVERVCVMVKGSP